MSAVKIAQLMAESGVGFGTSGARGLAADMVDRVCYAYTRAFLRFLLDCEPHPASRSVAIAGDFRPSTPRIMAAVGAAIRDAGFTPINCGHIPTPALALYGIRNAIPAIMVTGSHIPEDRNGIKFYKPEGEILKADEQAIASLTIEIADELFDASGMMIAPDPLPPVQDDARRGYLRRYLEFFPGDCLAGRRIGVYQHSSVSRDILVEALAALGADVVPLGRSPGFIPVDTEAIRDEDIALARRWMQQARLEGKPLDCIVSADGDGDRPLISDEHGEWLRGDIAGMLCARYLRADCVVTPISSNTAVEKSGYFKEVVRCRIGSPYVIEAMQQAQARGFERIVGYEANGGFLTGSDIEMHRRRLAALPTRDAVIVPLAILQLADGMPLSRLLDTLPRRFTASGRLKNFPPEISSARLAEMGGSDAEQNRRSAQNMLGEMFGEVAQVDTTDGVRITFASGDIVHLRASGNAPELRCYSEAASAERAIEINRIMLAWLENWRS